MPQVYNKRHNPPSDSVYVGRPTKWGNPYTIGRDGDRDQVIQQYRQFLNNNPALQEQVKQELKGKDLVCWCAPQACHADILLQLANE